MADGVAVLQHFGFAPQRFDSRKKPFARAALRLEQAFSCLALEAEGQDPKRKNCALELLEGLSGANSSRILLAGMLADVMWEVSAWVHAADEDDPDPWVVAHSFDRLWERLRLLFQNGWIVSEKNRSRSLFADF